MTIIFNFLNLFKSNNKVFLLSFYFLSVMIGILFVYNIEFGSIPQNELLYLKTNDPEMGLDFFYLLQDSGLVLVLYLLTTLLIPNLFSSDLLIYSNNKFDYMIITRTKTKIYNTYVKKVNFISTVILIILTHLFTLMVIQLFCFDIKFSINEIYMNATRQTTLFSNSLLLSLITYILLSSIGYGVFSNFLHSLQFAIKNIYLYKSLGISSALMIYIGSAIISKLLLDFTGNTFLATITHFINITNILTPGIIKSPILNNNYIIFYIGTLIMYYLISLNFYEIKEINKYEYDK